MKKRILSIMLVLTFIFCAIPAGVNAATGDGGAISDWTAKIGTIEALEDGVFSIKAYDESLGGSTLTNKKQVRQAMYNGEYTAATISITFDTASIMAGRGDGKSGGNDQGIIFGGSGIKAYGAGKTNYNAADIEKGACFYLLHFTNNRLILANINKDFKDDAGAVKPYKTITSVDLAATMNSAWDGMKASGKAKVTITYTEDGSLEVFVGPNRIDKLCQPAGTCVPYGGEIGIRTGMGYHVPTKIYEAEITPYSKPLDLPEDWFMKVGDGVGINEEGGFQINSGSGPRQAMWKKHLEEGKITVTFDTDSIFAGRGDGKNGSNDTAIIFGGDGILATTANSVNNIEKVSRYYCLMFSNNNLYIAKVDKDNTTVNDAGETVSKPWAGAVGEKADLAKVLGQTWTDIKATGKVTVTIEFTKDGATKVWVNDNAIDVLTKAAGECVPFGSEVGVRVGMGYHVSTKIYDWSIEGVITEDKVDDPELPGENEGENGGETEGGDNTDNENEGNNNAGNENTGNNNAGNDDAGESLDPNVGGNSANDNAPALGEADAQPEEDNNSMWIIIAAAAAGLIIIGVVLAIVLGKKKKA